MVLRILLDARAAARTESSQTACALVQQHLLRTRMGCGGGGAARGGTAARLCPLLPEASQVVNREFRRAPAAVAARAGCWMVVRAVAYRSHASMMLNVHSASKRGHDQQHEASGMDPLPLLLQQKEMMACTQQDIYQGKRQEHLLGAAARTATCASFPGSSRTPAHRRLHLLPQRLALGQESRN